MNKQTAYGTSVSTILFVVFLVLKLTHLLDISWWWVSAPLWAPLVLGLIIIAGGVVYYSIKEHHMEDYNDEY